MDQVSPPRRALILEDEVVIAIDLEQAMYELGFQTSKLASEQSIFPGYEFQALHRFGGCVLRRRARRDRGCKVAKGGLRGACSVRHRLHRCGHRRTNTGTVS
jgi:hypothetical protein